MKSHFSGLSIKGIAAAIPKNKNDVHELLVGVNDVDVDRIINNTGVKFVRTVTSGVKCSDLCYAATKKLFNELKIDALTIDAIVLVSQTPDFVTPATSVYLQHKLGLRKDILAFDINYGCSGYVYGLYQVSLLINSGYCNRVLLCVGDVISPLICKSDYQSRVLLSDGGSATLIEKGNDTFHFTVKSDGSGARHLIAGTKLPYEAYIEKAGFEGLLDGYFHMDGGKVMEFVLREVPSIIFDTLNYVKWGKDSVDLFVFHQANAFIVHYLRKLLKLSSEVVPVEIEETGNTNAASIPVLLSLNGESYKVQNKLNKVLLCGFGVGLSWGCVSLNLNSTTFCKPVEI